MLCENCGRRFSFSGGRRRMVFFSLRAQSQQFNWITVESAEYGQNRLGSGVNTTLDSQLLIKASHLKRSSVYYSTHTHSQKAGKSQPAIQHPKDSESLFLYVGFIPYILWRTFHSGIIHYDMIRHPASSSCILLLNRRDHRRADEDVSNVSEWPNCGLCYRLIRETLQAGKK